MDSTFSPPALGRSTVSIITILLVSTIYFGCNPKYALLMSLPSENDILPESQGKVFDLYEETTLDFVTVKKIKLHFHFINNQDSTVNFKEKEGRRFVHELLAHANQRMSDNGRMNLPEGNSTRVLDTKIRYILSEAKGGVSFHYSPEPVFFIKKGASANRYDRRLINDYAVEDQEVVNVLIQPFHPDQISSGEQKLEKTAIALNRSVKLPGPFQTQLPAWEYAGIFNHEIGHILGLRHSWSGNDGCDDTPHHDNCWNKTDYPPCNGLTSNNLMDYNAFQVAVTPCQIARMHATLSNPGRSAHRLIAASLCESDEEWIEINGQHRWSTPLYVNQNIKIRKKGQLYVTSMLLLSQNVRINIEKGGALIVKGATFRNSCESSWDGIYKHPKGRLIVLGDRNLLFPEKKI